MNDDSIQAVFKGEHATLIRRVAAITQETEFQAISRMFVFFEDMLDRQLKGHEIIARKNSDSSRFWRYDLLQVLDYR